MFMEHGFDGTTIDAVAEAAGVSKRTLYARYADKNALFSAVLRQLIDRWLLPINQFSCAKAGLEATLIEIGRQMLASALAPRAVSVHRILIAEAERHPVFARLATGEGRAPAIQAIAALLQRHGDELRIRDYALAAEQFMSLVIDHALKLAAMGIPADPAGTETRLRAAVDLFLRGAGRG